MKVTTLALGLFILTFSLQAQTNAPKYSNEFLAIGVDARALAMSGAFTAVSDDISSGYWNPAGLNYQTDDYAGSLMHAQYFAGIANYDYAAFSAKIDEVSTLAISAIRLGIDDIPDTRFLYDANGAINYDNIQFFSSADYGFLFSYARKLKILGGIESGLNAKIIYRNAGSFASAWGYGLDIGFQKSIKKLKIGLMLKDITGTYNTWNHNTSLVADIYTQTGNKIPENSIEITLPRAILGVSYRIEFLKKMSALVSVDLETTLDGKRNTLVKSDVISLDPKAGVELGYMDKFFIRGGIGQFQQIQEFDRSYTTLFQPNFGVGVKLNQFCIDYALTDVGDQTESPYSHVISIKATFNDKK
ncbi:putative type IX sorting system protein PorV2 [Reichenbachiella ulvae]|uniref:PorV/PorQ family protein n=1 Tax=Reichenbachiella ulvae TaxID=2980104 RepID=A0ABT3CPS8_9BACT|nr:PorV/PorQ family protein [Reichenbachiella ulvae]MCV9385649.1 PorV/PorQ family protein [Reichenbachiella ulvae]